MSLRFPRRGAHGGLIHPRSSCQCQWTCSCTRRSAAGPRRPWPWQGEHKVTAMMGTENLRLPSPHLPGHSPGEGLVSLDGNPDTSPKEWGVSLSPAQLTRNSWAGRRCRSKCRPAASGPTHPSLGERRVRPQHSAGTSHRVGTPAWHRDLNTGRMDSLRPFWVDIDLNWEAAPASDELEETAEIL